MCSGFKLLNTSCINVKGKKIGFKDASSYLSFLLNRQHINHIDAYVANDIDECI